MFLTLEECKQIYEISGVISFQAIMIINSLNVKIILNFTISIPGIKTQMFL